MLDLSDVTLCAADSLNVALTAHAMHLSMERCRFAEAIVYSPVPVAGNFRTVEVPAFDRAGYQAFRLKPPPIETPFALWIEWDGYVIDPRMWDARFREYDYIGARWPGSLVQDTPRFTVGNSGFCLQSKKLLTALNDPRFVRSHENVDVLICRTYRPILEREFGIRFAPENIADQFSYELLSPRLPTFGFHGMENMWRYFDDDQLIALLERADIYIVRHPQFISLVMNYAMQAKYSVVERLYAIMRKHFSLDAAVPLFRRVLEQPHADALLGLCEKLVSLK
jgi:hypothetical protein